MDRLPNPRMRRPGLLVLAVALSMVAMLAPGVFRSPGLVVGILAAALVANAWILWRIPRSAPEADAGDLAPRR